MQYLTNRYADIDDVIVNNLGGMMGYILFLLSQKCFIAIDWWRKMIGVNN
ncbi:VanZ family protein [Lysinibacillus fusiformis]